MLFRSHKWMMLFRSNKWCSPDPINEWCSSDPINEWCSSNLTKLMVFRSLNETSDPLNEAHSPVQQPSSMLKKIRAFNHDYVAFQFYCSTTVTHSLSFPGFTYISNPSVLFVFFYPKFSVLFFKMSWAWHYTIWPTSSSSPHTVIRQRWNTNSNNETSMVENLGTE